MATQGICEWGGCQDYKTPIVVTLPNEFEGGKVRKRFCCLEHLAAWAIKEKAKQRGGAVGNSIVEKRIEKVVIDEIARLSETRPSGGSDEPQTSKT